MIQIRLSVADLGSMRFAYSPLAEVAESLYLLSAQRIHPVHRGWFAAVRSRLGSVDLDLLRYVVPARPYIAEFLFTGARTPATTLDEQLDLVAHLSSDQLRDNFAAVWRDDPMPRVVRDLICDGPAGARRLADALHAYWAAAIEPHWPSMRAILDGDVAHRAGELTSGGVNAMLSDLHHQVSIQDDVLRIDKTHSAEEQLTAGLKLVPSVFVWPNIIFAAGSGGGPSLTYPARGVGKLWPTCNTAADTADTDTAAADGSVSDHESLSALLGRSRAAILLALTLPHSTTELSLLLDQSPPAVSQHLSVLRNSGLVTSWRNGRSVMYRRTTLADTIIEANHPTTNRHPA